MTEAENKAQIARIEKERIRLGTFWHFYRVVLSSLPDDFSPVAGINTAATDGKRIFWNLAYIATLTQAQLLFVLAHESLHCVLLHHLRGRGLDQRLLNIAGDYVINLLLTDEGIGEIPPGCLLDEQYRGWSTEQVYAHLAQQQAEQPKPQPQKAEEQGEDGDDQQGGSAGEGGSEGSEDGSESRRNGSNEDPQDGSESGEDGSGDSDTEEGSSAAGDDAEGSEGQGAGNQGSQDGAGDEAANGAGDAANGTGAGSGTGEAEDIDPGMCGGVIQGAHDAHEEAEQTANWQRVARSAVSAGAKQAGGKVDGVGQMVLGNLDTASVKWEDELAEFITVSISKDYAWSRPDNRFHGGDFMLPGLVSDAASHGVLMIDTSGSMSDDQINRCIAEVQSMADSGAVDRITVVCIDTEVHNVETFERGERITMGPVRRGGTRYQPAWDWLKEQDEAPDFVVYMTDLQPWDGFGEEPGVPLLWAASTYSVSALPHLRTLMAGVPFGRCIEVM